LELNVGDQLKQPF